MGSCTRLRCLTRERGRVSTSRSRQTTSHSLSNSNYDPTLTTEMWWSSYSWGKVSSFFLFSPSLFYHSSLLARGKLITSCPCFTTDVYMSHRTLSKVEKRYFPCQINALHFFSFHPTFPSCLLVSFSKHSPFPHSTVSEGLWVLANISGPITVSGTREFSRELDDRPGSRNATFPPLFSFAHPRFRNFSNFTDLFDGRRERDYTRKMWDGNVALVIRVSNLTNPMTFRVSPLPASVLCSYSSPSLLSPTDNSGPDKPLVSTLFLRHVHHVSHTHLT